MRLLQLNCIILLIIVMIPVTADNINDNSFFVEILDVIPLEGQVQSNNNYYSINSYNTINIISIYFFFYGISDFNLLGNDLKLMGDLFIIIDGITDKVNGLFNSSSGFQTQIILRPGIHVISMIYIGLNEEIVFDTDTVIIDIGDNTDLISTWPINIDFNDTIKNEKINQPLIGRDGLSGPEYPDHNFITNFEIDIKYTDIIDMDLRYDSYGSEESQTNDYYTMKNGIAFISDMKGLTPINEVINVTLIKGFSVIVFHKSGVLLETVMGFLDWEQLQDNFNNIDGSFDYSASTVYLSENENTEIDTDFQNITSNNNFSNSSRIEITQVSTNLMSNTEISPIFSYGILISTIILIVYSRRYFY